MCVAWSGIAANLLPNGQTVHSCFMLPLQLAVDTTCTISAESAAAERLRAVRVIIWDEAPMALSYAIDAIDRTLRFVCDIDLPFGGKTVVMGGDFRQVFIISLRLTSILSSVTIAISDAPRHSPSFTISNRQFDYQAQPPLGAFSTNQTIT